MAINKVGIVGGGLMGHGIAQICAQAGWDVVLREVDDERAAKGVGMIEKQLSRAVDKGRMEQSEAEAVRGRIAATTGYGELADCDLVIEAMTESLEGKLEMWRAIDPIVKADAFFATNTSSLAVIDQAAATSRPDRFLGLHFFNPAQVMPLLEVVQTVTTGEDVPTRSLIWWLRNLSILLENAPVVSRLAGSILLHGQKPPRKRELRGVSLAEHALL